MQEGKLFSIGGNLQAIHRVRCRLYEILESKYSGIICHTLDQEGEDKLRKEENDCVFELFWLELSSLFEAKTFETKNGDYYFQHVVKCNVFLNFNEDTLTYRWDSDPKGLRRTFKMGYTPKLLKSVQRSYLEDVGFARKEDDDEIVLSFWFPV